MTTRETALKVMSEAIGEHEGRVRSDMLAGVVFDALEAAGLTVWLNLGYVREDDPPLPVEPLDEDGA